MPTYLDLAVMPLHLHLFGLIGSHHCRLMSIAHISANLCRSAYCRRGDLDCDLVMININAGNWGAVAHPHITNHDVRRMCRGLKGARIDNNLAADGFVL